MNEIPVTQTHDDRTFSLSERGSELLYITDLNKNSGQEYTEKPMKSIGFFDVSLFPCYSFYVFV